MWKFQHFSVTQILREINFGEMLVSKTSIYDSYRSSDFTFGQVCTTKLHKITKYEYRTTKSFNLEMISRKI